MRLRLDSLTPNPSPPCGSGQFDRSYPAFILALLLSGCAAPPLSSPEASSAWADRQAALARLTVWNAAGRIGVVNGQDGWHASFQWAQQDPDYRIDLIGPLGQGRVVVQGGAGAVSVQTQDGQHGSAPDPDTLLEQSIGLRLPVNGLRYWIRGLPEPGPNPTIQTDGAGRLVRLEQNGWVIEYPAYASTSIFNFDLPERIVARRQDLSVKLVIEQWNL